MVPFCSHKKQLGTSNASGYTPIQDLFIELYHPYFHVLDLNWHRSLWRQTLQWHINHGSINTWTVKLNWAVHFFLAVSSSGLKRPRRCVVNCGCEPPRCPPCLFRRAWLCPYRLVDATHSWKEIQLAPLLYPVPARPSSGTSQWKWETWKQLMNVKKIYKMQNIKILLWHSPSRNVSLMEVWETGYRSLFGFLRDVK